MVWVGRDFRGHLAVISQPHPIHNTKMWGVFSFIFIEFSVKQEGVEKPLWKRFVFLKGHLSWKKLI